ncbi:MAG: hypothetical protein O2944_11450, partial [Proteobacteria bacterium]|nr:hypothetical protein [Pseudomonadota bacterium]
FDYHWAQFQADPGLRPLRGPRWRGQPIPKGNLLIRSEQGPGDEILFSTCLPDAGDRLQGGQIILEVNPRLVALMQRTFPAVQVIPRLPPEADGKYPKFAAELPASLLPALFRQSFEDFRKSDMPVYRADPALQADWRRRIDDLGPGRKIGIAWRGGGYGASQAKRTAALQRFLPILRTPGCIFVNLQYGHRAEEIADLQAATGIRVHDWPDLDPLVELEGQIAQISCLDLVLQVSNTSAHIAAALGVETWILQSHSPYWPWFLDRADVPWYSNARQFRMQRPGEWDSIIDRAAAALPAWVVQHNGGSA